MRQNRSHGPEAACRDPAPARSEILRLFRRNPGLRQFMRKFSLLTIGILGMSACSHTDVEDLMCKPSGMAGVTFGRPLEQRLASTVEVADSGVTYFNVLPSVDIQPFEKLIVGVSPKTKRVFSISLEMYGDEKTLDRTIGAFKDALSQTHASVSWRIIGNHHYGEQLEGLELVLYRIGDRVKGEQTYLLSYACDSRPYRRIVLEEATDANRGE